MLFGTEIEIRTDHLNLTRDNLQSQRLLKWRLAMEEFAPTVIYKPGGDNIVAHGLSRLPLLPRSEEQGDPPSTTDRLKEIRLYFPVAINSFPLDFAALSQGAQNEDDSYSSRKTTELSLRYY